MDSQQAFKELKDAVDAWVASLIPDDYTSHIRKPKRDEKKVIREAVSGYQTLEPYEVLILDSPLLQRLRYIHQTALAYLVYPTANHTRFDHSLGCAKIAQRMGEVLIPTRRTHILELRLAGLLHDVGHTFFSHLSECIMESHFRDHYKALKNAPQFRELDLSLGEMISYLIVKSPPFRKFLDEVVHPYQRDLDLDNVAQLIIHNPANKLAYMGDIISGPFDADKLDYLVRDCHFCGIRADVDVDRVVISTRILDRKRFPPSDPKWEKRILVMQSGGVSILEQITFNKMLLFPAVYHHHKVRAIECMVKSMFEIIWENPDEIRDDRLKFQNISDFYKFTDFEFITAARVEPQLKPIVERLLNRDLLKRCLVLFHHYLRGYKKGKKGKWIHLTKRRYETAPDKIRELRQWIWEELPESKRDSVSIHDIWVDNPTPPPIGADPDRAWVDIGTRELLPLTEFFPLPEWTTAYEINKLKGHVFSVADRDIRYAVNKAAINVFKYNKRFELEFEQRATDECKIPRL